MSELGNSPRGAGVSGSDLKTDIRVISFPTATERRDNFCAMMEHVDAPGWAFQDVVPAEELCVPYDDVLAFKHRRSILTKAELSCAASHLRAMQTFLAGDSDYLMVVEDDVMFDPNIRIQAHVDFMKLCGLDYYKLYARFFTPSHFLTSVGRFVFYRAMWPTLGTQCYIVSRAGAQRMLDAAAAKGGLRAPIDDTMDAYWETGLPIVFCYPFPVMEFGFPSTIHNTRHEKDVVNEELAKTIKPQTRLATMRKTLDRRQADRRMRGFDHRLTAVIVENHEKLSNAFHH